MLSVAELQVPGLVVLRLVEATHGEMVHVACR